MHSHSNKNWGYVNPRKLLWRAGALLVVALLASSAAANTAPTAASMATGVYENDVLEFYAPGVLTNATDPENDPLTAQLVLGPQNGALVLNADGSFTYTPNPNFSGTDNFQFAAFDGEFQSAPAVVAIDVIAVNSAPVGQSQDFNVVEDVVFTQAAPGVLAGATDADSDPLTVALQSGPANGTLALLPDGSFSYEPNANYFGPDSFTVIISDGQAQSAPVIMNINVLPVNDAPAGSDTTFMLNEDETLQVAAPGLLDLCTDIEADVLAISIVALPQKGTLIPDGAGGFTFQPAQDFNGDESFEYMVSDGQLDSGPYRVTLRVAAVNDAPVAQGAAFNVREDEVLSAPPSALLAGASDIDGDALSVILAGLPASGTLVVNDDGSFTYAPVADFNGNDSFTFYVTDGQAQSQIVTVALFVEEVNDAPSFIGGGDVSVFEDDGAIELPWAKAISAGPADESWQRLDFTVTGFESSPLFAVAPTISADGMLRFTLLPDAWGAATLTVTLHDNGGSALPGDEDASIAYEFNILVVATSDAPSFIPGGDITALEDCGSVTMQWAKGISSGAGDAAQALIFVVSEVAGGELFDETPTLDAAGVLRFTPCANANGLATFSVILMEDNGLDAGGEQSVAQMFRITLRAVNDAPSFMGGNVAARTGGEAVALSGWAHAISAGPADEQGQSVVFQVMDVDNPGLFEVQPTVDAQGTLNFKAAKGVKGTASIMLRIVDDGSTEFGGENASAIQTFNISLESHDGSELQLDAGSCTTGSGSGPWAWLLAPLAALALLRRRSARA
jgi:MYXO-CTERM domain-containing protein